MISSVNTVIFDMDGVIIDSEPIQLISYNIVLKRYGAELDEADFISQCVGHKGYDIWTFLRDRFNIPESTAKLLSEKNTVYTSLIKENIHPMPGLLSLLDHLTRSKYHLAVASSSSISDIERILQGIGIRQLFQAIVSGEEVPNGKPAPDIFLESAHQLNVDPSMCVVLEDSQTGVQAAISAGMYCIAIPNRFTNSQDFSQAHMRVPDLLAVSTLL